MRKERRRKNKRIGGKIKELEERETRRRMKGLKYLKKYVDGNTESEISEKEV